MQNYLIIHSICFIIITIIIGYALKKANFSERCKNLSVNVLLGSAFLAPFVLILIVGLLIGGSLNARFHSK